MPRGGKTKTIDQHIESGTFRQDRQGVITTKSDYEKLERMKESLFNSFNEIKSKLEKTDINKEQDTYKMLNGVMIEQIKAFFSITKYPIKKDEAKPNGKIDLKEYS